MFTAELIGETKNIELRRRMVNVQFTDGKITFAKEFQFSINEDVGVMKRTVKNYLDEINQEPPAIEGAITDVGALPTPEPQDPNQVAQDAWEQNFAKLEKVKRLIDVGVLSTTDPAVVALRKKVKDDMKASYL